MSDLFCAARLIFARHSQAEYVDTFFSDEGGSLTLAGREQAARLARTVSGERISRIWCSDSARAVQTAEIAAAVLGVSVITRKSLREIRVGDLAGEPFDQSRLTEIIERWEDGDLAAAFPGGESGHEVIARYAEAFGEIADLHRGETVLVIGHESIACAALPQLAAGLPRPRPEATRSLPNGETVELEGDSDGWVIHRWAGLRLG